MYIFLFYFRNSLNACVSVGLTVDNEPKVLRHFSMLNGFLIKFIILQKIKSLISSIVIASLLSILFKILFVKLQC